MKEDFLHYIWQNKKFDFTNLQTKQGEDLVIMNVGQYLQQEGPDFFNAQITINNQKWAGNIEIHLQSSDWYMHRHEKDANYDSIILHVVWQHDAEVFRKDNTEIPVLELKNYVNEATISNYKALTAPKSWIFCQNQIATVEEWLRNNWLERLFLERLEQKAVPFAQLLQENHNNWEATLFVMLAKNFGLNVNGTSFLEMAKVIPFHVLKKESFEVENLEALFFGTCNMLDKDFQDNYCKDLKKRYLYLHQKHQLTTNFITPIQFFKLRPDNFPTVRLAQLAMLYHQKQNLFSEISTAKSKKEMYAIFKHTTSNYWESHYNLDKESNPKAKKISVNFIDLLLINTILPMQFLYAKSKGKDITEELLNLIQEIKPEKNTIIEKFEHYKIPAKNALDSQAFLQLKNNYCNKQKCMQCAIGLSLLKNN